AKAAEAKARNEQPPRKNRPTPGGATVLDTIGLPGAGAGAGGGAATPGGIATFVADPSPSGPSTRAERERSSGTPDRANTVGVSTPAPPEVAFAPAQSFVQ